MNSYAIDLSAGGKGFGGTQTQNLRKAVGYMILYAGNSVVVTPQFRAETIPKGDFETDPQPLQNFGLGNVYSPPIISFDLDFSLSNITNFWDVELAGVERVVAMQTVYDTNCQSVREYVDKPYAVKGYIAVVSVPNGEGDPSADFDGFVRFPYSDHNGDVGYIYVGTVNSSATDFYTPFKNLEDNVTYIDPRATATLNQTKSRS